MRAIVVGASGQIGGWLSRVLFDRGHEVVGTYATVPYPGLVRLDASDLDAARGLVESIRPDVVFYPAGFTWVDGCERDPARAWAANLEQPLNIARAVAASGGRFVYFSTDYVFDGRNGPYREDSPTNPLSAYGRSKLDAERALAEELKDRQLTARTSWVFGPERQGKNFAYQLLRSLKAGKPVECPSDQISSPSYAPDVASAVVALVEAGESGLIHVAGPEAIDRVRFARSIAEAWAFDPGSVVGKPTAELGQGAPRPLNGGLAVSRLTAFDPTLVRPLAAALADFRSAVADGLWADPLASSQTS